MKKIFILLLPLFLFLNACKKNNHDDNPSVSETEVLTDFANVLANPNYQDIQLKAFELNLAAQTLNTSVTSANLIAAQNAWRAVRIPWEQCEGFLFGPVEDFNYDPETDSWPVNTVELDSLLASSNPLTLADIDNLPLSLRGYHPAEYILFGVGGTKTAAELNPRQLQYLTSLTESLYNSATALRNSWDVNVAGNFTQELITAGNGSLRYPTRKEAFVDIVSAMTKICNEVANNKMQLPFVALDSTIVESQYAHNATVDFKNNIVGIQNAYLCRYKTTGKSLHDMVAAKNISLDNSLQTQINAAINSFNNIDENYGLAIFTQPGQIQASQNAINTLRGSLNLLNNFILTTVKD
jgi:uncharacterized iron-regulated protein